jgi:DNA (cytosine-5)-methyltransferase 1
VSYSEHTFGSLFAGVGGFDMGFENAGWSCKFQVEWDKNCQTILNRHWPDVPKWGDVSTVSGYELPPVECIIFGSPCQDLSVAGKRAGLEGARSGLFFEAVRIIKEMRDATGGTFPRWTVWENVAGALSSNQGRDFGAVISEMVETGAVLQEYALLDAQHFGVPQRRRRVFLVSCFDPATAERCPDPLLSVSESVRGDSQKGKPKGQATTGTTAAGFGSGSFGGWTETDTAITLSARDHKSSNTIAVESFTGTSHAQYGEGVGTIRANGGDLGGGSETLLVEPFVKSRRAQTSDDDETWVEGEVNPTLNSFDVGDTRATTAIVEPMLIDGTRVDDVRVYEPPVQTLKERMGTGGNNVPMLAFDTQFGSNANVFEDHSPTLKASQQSPTVAIPIQDGREMEKRQNGFGVASDGEPSYTLDQTGAQAVAYSVREDAKANTFSATELDHANALSALRPSPQSHHAQMFIAEVTANAYDEYNDRLGGDIHHALRAGTKQSTGVLVDAAGFKPGASADARTIGYEEGVSPSLEGGGGGNNKPAILTPTMAVRRLTPLECERLMGWADEHTRWKADGTEQADTHRYKQCGNGVASPVAQWIATHIRKANEIQ